MYKLDMPVTRQCSDKGEWYWGGRFCIPHEVKLSETGDLLVDIPQEFTESIHKTIPWNYLPVLGEYKRYGAESIVLDAFYRCCSGCSNIRSTFLSPPT